MSLLYELKKTTISYFTKKALLFLDEDIKVDIIKDEDVITSILQIDKHPTRIKKSNRTGYLTESELTVLDKIFNDYDNDIIIPYFNVDIYDTVNFKVGYNSIIIELNNLNNYIAYRYNGRIICNKYAIYIKNANSVNKSFNRESNIALGGLISHLEKDVYLNVFKG